MYLNVDDDDETDDDELNPQEVKSIESNDNKIKMPFICEWVSFRVLLYTTKNKIMYLLRLEFSSRGRGAWASS